MGTIAIQRIKREFKEVVKSEEVSSNVLTLNFDENKYVMCVVN